MRHNWLEVEQLHENRNAKGKEGPTFSCNPVMFVKKKGGAEGAVVDLRHLNTWIHMWNWPFPLVRDMVQQLTASGCLMILALDLKDAFQCSNMQELLALKAITSLSLLIWMIWRCYMLRRNSLKFSPETFTIYQIFPGTYGTSDLDKKKNCRPHITPVDHKCEAIHHLSAPPKAKQVLIADSRT